MKTANLAVSILIPTHNEEQNITPLVERIHTALKSSKFIYEVIVVDDNSTDKTQEIVTRLAKKFPVKLLVKEGKRGKAFSIMQGYTHATYATVVMIDADLQYPPEAIPEMLEKLAKSDVVIANRKNYTDSKLRHVLNKCFRFVFARLLFGIEHDVQSGLKAFKKEVLDLVSFVPSTGWTLDLELIHRARLAGYKIVSHDITFEKRNSGKSKIGFIKSSLEIGLNALRVRTKRIDPLQILSINDSMLGAGIRFKKNHYVTHTTLPHRISAIETVSRKQKIFFATLFAFLIFGVAFDAFVTLVTLIAFLSFVYFVDVLFSMFITIKTLHHEEETLVTPEEIAALDDKNLPKYTILCPLYKEAHIIPTFLTAMGRLEWPKNKLEVLLLLEEDDTHSIEEVKKMTLPSYVQVVVVPESQPKTKPKACNYGLSVATGEYLVVYDAEDIPEVDQLKKAYLAFSKVAKNVLCLQAKLNYFNPHQNLLTRFFTAEYSLWFDLTLTGLQGLQTTIPLGGTSNHFRTADLLRLQGWDPFNVTEDADLGMRLFKDGYKTAIIDSTTYEEANSKVGNWIRQRSRWIKGYMQTYLVHNRAFLSMNSQGLRHLLFFHLVIGGKIAFILINPILWLATFSYFAFYAYVGPQIEAIYPSYVFYMAAFSLIFGNFLFLYNYMIGCINRKQYSLVKYTFLVPFYWLLISFAGFVALFQLIFKPHYWEKTAHGLHLVYEETQKEKVQLQLAVSKSRAARLQRFVDLIQSKQIWGGGLLIASSLIGNLMNFLYNAYLGRHLTLEDFGEISLFGSLLSLSTVPLSAFSRTVTHTSAFLLGKFGIPVKPLWFTLKKRSLFYSIGISLLWLLLTPLLMRFFRVDSALPFILFAPVWVIGTFNALNGGFLNGNLLFATTAITAVLESTTKFAFTAGFVNLELHKYVYASIPLSLFLVLLVEWWSISRLSEKQSKIELVKKELSLSKKFYFTSILTSLTKATYLSLDLVLAKHFLTPTEAGAYSYLSLAGKMVFFLSSTISQFLIPYISRDVGAGMSPKKSFRKLLLLISIVNFVAFLIFGVFGYITAPLLWGDKAALIIDYLPAYALAMALFSTTSAIITYQQIRGRHIFPIFAFLLALLMILGMYLEHHSIGEIVLVVSIASVISLSGVLLLSRFYGLIMVVFHACVDFIELFKPLSPTSPLVDGKLRVLIFNWRDLQHKWAGGAEVYLHELGKRWVDQGHEVTIFSGNDGRSARFESIKGIKHIRRGGFYLVYFWAFLYYFFRLRGRYDVIIDSENGLPFFTSLYAKEPVFLLIHHVHQEVFRKRLVPPFSWIALFLERHVMPLVYRQTEVITVSPSSKSDILLHKLSSRDPHIIYNGVDLSTCVPGKKSKTPTLLYLGRLTNLKSVHILVQVVQSLHTTIPDLRVMIAGDGPARKSLQRLTKKLKLDEVITFTGRVSEEEKVKLYQEAWVFVNPSLIEGWGITTIEANACGTPVVASNVAGLRDSVRDGHSGFLVPYGEVEDFKVKITNLLLDTKLRRSMSQKSITWAVNFNWDASASLAMQLLKSATQKQHEFTWITKSKSPSYPDNLVLGKAKYQGEIIFVKSWFNPPTSAFNEVNAYQNFSSEFNGKVRLPKLLFFDKVGETLTVGLEYIDGTTLSDFNENKQLEVYKEVLTSLSTIYFGNDTKTPKRSGRYILLTFPYILIKAAKLRPKYALLIFTSAYHFILNAINLLKGELKLAHRDLGTDNIIISGEHIYLIDWQYVAFTLPMYELASAWRSVSRNKQLGSIFLNLIKTEYQNNSLALAQFKSLSIYYTLLGLTDPKYQPTRVDDFINLLRTANKL